MEVLVDGKTQITDSTISGGTINGTSIGSTTPAAGIFTTVKVNNDLAINEITTPSAISGYGKLYTKTDNELYFQDGAGNEHTVSRNTPQYGEMYIYNNSNATIIETADTPIALRQISDGLNLGFTFHAGSTGGITAYADYSGTVAGTVLVTDAGHGLSTGDIITIRGTTNYNGVFAITVVSVDTFYITDTWVNDNGASDWDQGASLTAQTGAAGIYTSTWQMTTAPTGACTLCFKVNINTTPQNKSTACRDMAINDKDNNSSTCLLTIAEEDIIWLSVENDSTSDITNSMGNMNLERLAT